MVKCTLRPSTPLDPMFVEPPTASTPNVAGLVLDGGERFAAKALKALQDLADEQGLPSGPCAERPNDADD